MRKSWINWVVFSGKERGIIHIEYAKKCYWKCCKEKHTYLCKNYVKRKGCNKLKQEILRLDRIQIDALAIAMVQHWNRVSKDILDSLFPILKMGQTDICQWCGTDVLLRAHLLLHFCSNSYTSVKRKSHMNQISKNCMHTRTDVHFPHNSHPSPENPF